MSKQQFTFTLSAQQVREAVEIYAGLMVDPKTHELSIVGSIGSVSVTATKRRVRKSKPKVAAVKDQKLVNVG